MSASETRDSIGIHIGQVCPQGSGIPAMVAYRRNRVSGGSYFFTVALLDRSSCLLTARVGNLREAIRSVRRERPFAIEAMVVLPDHLHCIWRLPPGDGDDSLSWREIKARFSRGVPAGERRSPGRVNRGERGIWQRRFWEHTRRDERDVERQVDYIHYNPVKHGYVSRVADWPYSSFHRFVRLGVYPLDWGGSQEETGAGLVSERGSRVSLRSTQATRAATRGAG